VPPAVVAGLAGGVCFFSRLVLCPLVRCPSAGGFPVSLSWGGCCGFFFCSRVRPLVRWSLGLVFWLSSPVRGLCASWWSLCLFVALRRRPLCACCCGAPPGRLVGALLRRLCLAVGPGPGSRAGVGAPWLAPGVFRALWLLRAPWPSPLSFAARSAWPASAPLSGRRLASWWWPGLRPLLRLAGLRPVGLGGWGFRFPCVGRRAGARGCRGGVGGGWRCPACRLPLRCLRPGLRRGFLPLAVSAGSCSLLGLGRLFRLLSVGGALVASSRGSLSGCAGSRGCGAFVPLSPGARGVRGAGGCASCARFPSCRRAAACRWRRLSWSLWRRRPRAGRFGPGCPSLPPAFPPCPAPAGSSSCAVCPCVSSPAPGGGSACQLSLFPGGGSVGASRRLP